jgi:hypothetical protein
MSLVTGGAGFSSDITRPQGALVFTETVAKEFTK